MITLSDTRAWAEARLADHRIKLESIASNEIVTAVLRGRIGEMKELLAALENKAPPVWLDGSEDPSL